MVCHFHVNRQANIPQKRSPAKRDGKEIARAGIRLSGVGPWRYRAPIRTAASDAVNRDAEASTRSQPGMGRTKLPRPLPHAGCASPAPAAAYPLRGRRLAAPANPMLESPYHFQSSRCRCVVPASGLQAAAGSDDAPGESPVPVSQPATQPQPKLPLWASKPVVGLGVPAPQYREACDIFCKVSSTFCTAPNCRNHNVRLRVSPR